MRFFGRKWTAVALGAIVAACVHDGALADEGMWLFNVPPRQQVRDRYGVELTPEWLDHVQRASVRFNNGGSGCFVSPEGLVLTNQHIVGDAVQKLSWSGHDFLRNGFQARAHAEELKCEGLELNVLVSIVDVTARMKAALAASPGGADAAALRRRTRAAIEKESLEETGLRSDVVTLYRGGEYHLYRYKRYTDVRLVFVPEQAVAFFGGDPDNFEFPRYCLDAAFVRVYENEKPARSENFLMLQPRGVAEKDVVFAAGHPGSTNRSLSVAEFESSRDLRVPATLAYLKAKEVALASWAQRSPENARRARQELISVQNVRKVYDARYASLLESKRFDAKSSEELPLQAYAAAHAEFADTVSAWKRLADSEKISARTFKRKYLLETTVSESARVSGRVPLNFDSVLASIARVLLRAPTEKAKADGERLAEYRDANLPSLELSLLSNEAVDEELEQLRLTVFLTHMAQELGLMDDVVKVALDGKAPAARAAELIHGTQVGNVDFRRRVYAMSAEEIARLNDPMIAFVRALDPASRAVRKISEAEAETKASARAQIAAVRYAKDGASVYPDATFTLRLSYGAVRRYKENQIAVPAFATLGGIYERSLVHHGHEPYELPESWLSAERAVDSHTPFNFVSTLDIVGGNSGSPVINRAGECVGLIFDQNLYSIGGDMSYDDEQARAIAVDVRGLIEALRRIYKCDTLLSELLPPRG